MQALDVRLGLLARSPALAHLLECATEDPAGQRAVRHDAETVTLAGGQHLELDAPDEQVVLALLGDQTQEVPRPGGLVRLGDVPPGEVAAPHVQDLAGLHEDLDRLPDLLPGGLAVDVVELVEVDVIGLQAPEALVARATDVQGGQTRLVRPLAHRREHLRREHDLLATTATLREPPSDDLLRDAFAAPAVLAPAVHVGRIEEVDPVLDRTVHDAERLGFLRAGQIPAEVHRAETQRTHLHSGSSEVYVLHLRSLLS